MNIQAKTEITLHNHLLYIKKEIRSVGVTEVQKIVRIHLVRLNDC